MACNVCGCLASNRNLPRHKDEQHPFNHMLVFLCGERFGQKHDLLRHAEVIQPGTKCAIVDRLMSLPAEQPSAADTFTEAMLPKPLPQHLQPKEPESEPTKVPFCGPGVTQTTEDDFSRAIQVNGGSCCLEAKHSSLKGWGKPPAHSSS